MSVKLTIDRHAAAINDDLTRYRALLKISSAVGTHIDESSSVKTASIKISQPATVDKGFNLAGGDQDKPDETKKPPEKPKFFRKWL